MNFTIDAADLARALAFPVKAPRNSIDWMQNARFALLDDGRIEVTTTDLEVQVTRRATAVIDAGGAGAVLVPHDRLQAIVTRLEGPVSVTATSVPAWPASPGSAGWSLTISTRVGSRKRRYALPALDARNFMDLAPEGELPEVDIDPGALADAIKAVSYITGSDDMRHARPYVGHIILQAGEVCTTDGHRAAVVPLAIPGERPTEAIIPRTAAQHLLGALDAARQSDPEAARAFFHGEPGTPRRLVVRTPGLDVVSAFIDTRPPRLRAAMPLPEDEPLARFNAPALADAVRRVLAASTDGGAAADRIEITGEGGWLTLRNANAEDGIEAELPRGGVAETGMNGHYLVAMLGRLRGECAWWGADQQAPQVFQSLAETEHATHYVMPMRL